MQTYFDVDTKLAMKLYFDVDIKVVVDVTLYVGVERFPSVVAGSEVWWW